MNYIIPVAWSEWFKVDDTNSVTLMGFTSIVLGSSSILFRRVKFIKLLEAAVVVVLKVVVVVLYKSTSWTNKKKVVKKQHRRIINATFKVFLLNAKHTFYCRMRVRYYTCILCGRIKCRWCRRLIINTLTVKSLKQLQLFTTRIIVHLGSKIRSTK